MGNPARVVPSAIHRGAVLALNQPDSGRTVATSFNGSHLRVWMVG